MLENLGWEFHFGEKIVGYFLIRLAPQTMKKLKFYFGFFFIIHFRVLILQKSQSKISKIAKIPSSFSYTKKKFASLRFSSGQIRWAPWVQGFENFENLLMKNWFFKFRPLFSPDFINILFEIWKNFRNQKGIKNFEHYHRNFLLCLESAFLKRFENFDQ